MALPMTYSRRKRLREQQNGTSELRTFPFGTKLLQQLFSLFQQIDAELDPYDEPLFRRLVSYMRQEKGVGRLSRANSIPEEFFHWWMSENQTRDEDHVFRLDAVELACVIPFEWIQEHAATDPQLLYRPADNIRQLVQTINARMAEDSFAFRFEGKQLVEVSSEFLHESAVAPLLALTSRREFAAVDQEFRDALAEFRAENYDDCIADCGNAFESALKVIAAKKRWAVKPTDRAAALIDLVFRNGLVPAHLQSQFTGLRSVIQGVPTMRNNEGGHGGGLEPLVVDRHFAEYQLQQTAAVILFLVKCAD